MSSQYHDDLFEHTINNDVTIRSDEVNLLGRIDQYDIIRELGGGGFGSVYLAKDTVAGVDVAVKGLPPIIRNNSEELERIRDNFALVSRLHHPYIAAALHLQLARDVVYASEDVRQKLRVMPGDTLLMMEYAPGVTLSRWRKQFRDGKVPFEQAIQIVWQVAQALDYAHEQHVIHRDVKPSNVIVETSPDGEVIARLLDFGLAAEIRSSLGRVSREIRDTSGTRPYMAPEQWLGHKQGPATDQYALAVMLCELLAGEVPFASVFETGDPIVMMTAICNNKVVLPTGCPCQSVLLRALAKDPDKRFTSCMEFVETIADGGHVMQSCGDLQPRREGKQNASQKDIINCIWSYTREHKVGLLIALYAFVVALIMCGVWGLVHRQRQQERVRRQAKIIAEQKKESDRVTAERKAADEERKVREKAKLDEARRKAQEISKRKSEEKRIKSEATLKFISAFATERYDIAASLMNSIDSDNAEVQFDLAKMYDNGWGVPKNGAEATRWYIKAAEQGYDKAQNNLGVKYKDGDGVNKDATKAFLWFRKAAEQGCALAQTNVGMMYRDGKGVKKSYPEAMSWFRKAAEQGDALAQICLSGMYLKGWGCEIDEKKAFEWGRKAANQDVDRGQYVLGICYANGVGVEKDAREAAYWFRKAADQGYLEAKKALEELSKVRIISENQPMTVSTQQFLKDYKAERYSAAAKLIKQIDCDNAEVQFNLGYMYEYGKGVAKNYEEALKWYRKAANQNLAAAQFNIGYMYAEGKGVDKSMSEAVRWYRKAAEQGYAAAQNNLGMAYRCGNGIARDDYMGVSWYHKAAEQGYAMAMNNLGLAYASGHGVEKDEYEAVRWYRKAAEQGYAAAQYHLGLAYAHGSGVSKNESEAVRWYLKAAEQGFVDAQCNLGVCYAYGCGVPRDYAESMRWYRKAALQGDAQSQFNIGVMYHFGFGVTKNKSEAIRWYRKAAEQGHADAKKNLKAIYNE